MRYKGLFVSVQGVEREFFGKEPFLSFWRARALHIMWHRILTPLTLRFDLILFENRDAVTMVVCTAVGKRFISPLPSTMSSTTSNMIEYDHGNTFLSLFQPAK